MHDPEQKLVLYVERKSTSAHNVAVAHIGHLVRNISVLKVCAVSRCAEGDGTRRTTGVVELDGEH